MSKIKVYSKQKSLTPLCSLDNTYTRGWFLYDLGRGHDAYDLLDGEGLTCYLATRRVGMGSALLDTLDVLQSIMAIVSYVMRAIVILAYRRYFQGTSCGRRRLTVGPRRRPPITDQNIRENGYVERAL